MGKAASPRSDRVGIPLRKLVFGTTRLREQSSSHSMFATIARPAPAKPRKLEELALKRLRAELASTLGAVTGTRRVLRHLDHLERALLDGPVALAGIPPRVLRRMHAEMRILLNVAPASVGLVALERRLKDCLASHDQATPIAAGRSNRR